MYEIDFGQMCIGTKGVEKGDGERGHVHPHFQKCGGTIGFVPPHFSSPSNATGNWLSNKICISFTNKDVIYFFLQNFVWTKKS